MEKRLQYTYDMLNDYLSNLFDTISVSSLIPREDLDKLNILNVQSSIFRNLAPSKDSNGNDVEYRILEVCTVNELLSLCRLDMILRDESVNSNTKEFLVKRYFEYFQIRPNLYHYKGNSFGYDLLRAYKADYEESLSEYGLPVKFTLDNVLDASKHYNEEYGELTDDFGTVLNLLCTIFNDMFENKTLDEYPLSDNIHGYSSKTLNSFLTYYSINKMYDKHEITSEIYAKLIEAYNDYYYNSNKGNSRSVFEELGIPFEIDLSKFINKQVNEYQKIGA